MFKTFPRTIVSVLVSFLFVATIVNASTTISTGVTTGGDLSVTGISTLTDAVTMSSTLAVTGNTTLTGTLDVTGKTTVVNASTTRLSFGSAGTTMTGFQFGYCNIANSASVTASSTSYFNCTGAGTVDNTYRVFVQATSSLSGGLVLHSASTTATAGTINIMILNASSTSLAPGDISLNYWAIK